MQSSPPSPPPPSSRAESADALLLIAAGTHKNEKQRSVPSEEVANVAPDSNNTNNNSTPPDNDYRSIPAFTPEDEQEELATLSLKDVAEVSSDITGISNLLAAVSTGSTSSGGVGALSAADVMGLEQEMTKLPKTETSSYYRAVQLCPDQVSLERKAMFFEHEDGNVPRAARRLAEYWKLRLEVFGPNRCFLPMTLVGAMKDQAIEMAKHPVTQLLPVTDVAGRAVLYYQLKRRNHQEYDVQQELMALWYLVETIMEDDNRRRRGIVHIVDAQGVASKYFSLKFIRTSDRMFQAALPVSLRARHICLPDDSANPFFLLIIPIVKTLLSKNARLRTLLHRGSTEQMLAQLQQCSLLTRDRIPTEMGGLLVTNICVWMRERVDIEEATRRRNGAVAATMVAAQRLAINSSNSDTAALLAALTSAMLVPHPTVVSAAAMTNPSLGIDATPAAKRPRVLNAFASLFSQGESTRSSSTPAKELQGQRIGVNEAVPAGNAAQATSSSNANQNLIQERPWRNIPTDSLSDAQLYQRILEEKKVGNNNRSDPRMDAAVIARLNDPTITRLDALLAGGFTFMNRPKQLIELMKQSDVFDEENVSLGQRKNQLNRRLRQADVWIREARGNSNDDAQAS